MHDMEAGVFRQDSAGMYPQMPLSSFSPPRTTASPLGESAASAFPAGTAIVGHIASPQSKKILRPEEVSVGAKSAGGSPLVVQLGILRAVCGQFGTNIDLCNLEGKSAIHYTADHCRVDMMEHLLGMGADCNAGGHPLLHHVAGQGVMSVCMLLLKYGCDPHTLDGNGWTALHAACTRTGTAEIVVMLASLVSHSTCDTSGSTPLHIAAQSGCVPAIQALCGMGADLDIRDAKGCSPLATACYCNHPKAAELLLNRGADPNAQDNHMRAPIQFAAASRWEASRVIKLLLDKGADPNASAGGTATALQILIEQKIPAACSEAAGAKRFGEGSSASFRSISDPAAHAEACDAAISDLLKRGADPTWALRRCLEELSGSVPASEARVGVLKQLIGALGDLSASLDMLPHLVRTTAGNTNFETFASHLCILGANVQRDHDGSSHTAYIEVAEAVCAERISVMRGKEMLRNLRQHAGVGKGDGGIHSAQFGGRTSLHHVLYTQAEESRGFSHTLSQGSGCVELAHGLITLSQSDTNACDANGTTPLQLAVQHGSLDMAQLLLEFNAKPDEPGKLGWTPLARAIDDGNVEMVACLVKYGACMPLEEALPDTTSKAIRKVLKEESHRRKGSKTPLNDTGKTPLTDLIAAVRGDPGSPLKHTVRPPHMHIRNRPGY